MYDFPKVLILVAPLLTYSVTNPASKQPISELQGKFQRSRAAAVPFADALQGSGQRVSAGGKSIASTYMCRFTHTEACSSKHSKHLARTARIALHT